MRTTRAGIQLVLCRACKRPSVISNHLLIATLAKPPKREGLCVGGDRGGGRKRLIHGWWSSTQHFCSSHFCLYLSQNANSGVENADRNLPRRGEDGVRLNW